MCFGYTFVIPKVKFIKSKKMKKIIITLAALMLAGSAVNAQVKTKKVTVAAESGTKVSRSKMEAAVVAPTVVKEKVAPVEVAPVANALPQTPAVAPKVYNFDEFAKVDKMEHDFGTSVKQLPDGVSATFNIKNIGKEPLLIENVQASCGCTIPAWDKSPIAPGKTGSFTAKYNSQGRPGSFTKSLTIMTNRGTKAVTIKGTVEANAPAPADAPVAPAGH
jgi:Protein of unknown function (DUF1573)